MRSCNRFPGNFDIRQTGDMRTRRFVRATLSWVLALGILIVAVAANSASAATPSFREVVASYRTSETRFTDRHGEVVQVLRTDPAVRKLAWTPLAEVSPALRTALVYSEDRRFYEHSGVDWQAVGSAAWGNLWNTKTRGASTITMQLAGLLDHDLYAASGGRSIGQKLSQAATALAIERQWKKDEILEAYLNLVGYRGELVGIGALSATLFEKYPSGLNAREGAIAAALVRAPNATAARVAERACAILRAESLADECRGLEEFTTLVLARKAAPRLDSDPQLAPQFARVALRAYGPMSNASAPVVATTLDAGLQRYARATLRTHLAELAQRNVEDGAVIVLDNATGDVLAWVGSSGNLSDAAEVDHVLAPRQAGSTLKPFLYELAIEKRWLTAASILDDSPVDLATAGGLYIPQDYDHDFKGPVSVRTALASSLNVPAVRTLVMVTPERFHQRLRALGFTTLRESGDYYGYSLALGSAEVTLAQLTNAYRALANGGRVGDIAFVTKPASSSSNRTSRDAKQTTDPAAMDPAASSIVADILSDRNARATTFGMDSVLTSRVWSAVKTGTSKDMRDNWCVGFTDRYTVGVWVGNSGGESMWDVSGTTGAAPVWAAVVGYLAAATGSSARSSGTGARIDPGVVVRDVRFDHDLEAPRRELFLAATETTLIQRNAWSPSPSHRGSAAAGNGIIAVPVSGTIVAIDPDIPPQRQRMKFHAPGADASVRWRLDGRVLGRGSMIDWPVWPGKHELELRDRAGALIDRVHFEVRGATVQPRVARNDPR
jgi:penicillin-binding protein 1C